MPTHFYIPIVPTEQIRHPPPASFDSILTKFISIFQIPNLGTKLKQDSIPLLYTPRKFITHPTNNYFYLIEGDHRVMGEGAAEEALAELVRSPRLLNQL